MKNLLVDALRQASGVETPAAEEAPVERVTETGVQVDGVRKRDRGANDKELELIESTVLPRSAAPPVQDGPDESSVEAAAHPDEPAAGHVVPASPEPIPGKTDPHVETNIVDPTMVVRSLDSAAMASAEMRQTGKVARPRQGRLITLARWSPALCLIALSAAAGSLAFYQKLSAESLNYDLSALPSPSGADAVDSGGVPAWQTIAETNENAVAKPQAPVTGEANARQSPVALSQGSRPISGNASASVTAENSTVIEDPLYADVQRAYGAYAAGRMSDAETQYRNILQQDGNYRHALAGLAAVLQRTARAAESIAIYERLLSIDPNDTAAAASLAAHADYDDAVSGETRIKVLLQRNPNVAALHFSLGLLMAGDARWPEAYESFLAASELAPDNADFNYNVAVSAQRLGHVGKARAYYSRALVNAGNASLVDREAIINQLDQLSGGEGESS